MVMMLNVLKNSLKFGIMRYCFGWFIKNNWLFLVVSLMICLLINVFLLVIVSSFVCCGKLFLRIFIMVLRNFGSYRNWFVILLNILVRILVSIRVVFWFILKIKSRCYFVLIMVRFLISSWKEVWRVCWVRCVYLLW